MAKHLTDNHGQGVDLLARGATWHPHPELDLGGQRGPIVLQQLGQNIKGLRIAKKSGDIDQQVVQQGRCFFSIVPEQAHISIKIGHLADGHAALQLPAQGGFLVLREIHPRALLEMPQDGVDALGLHFLTAGTV